jgi:tripartite-type tricarboxylate transporter receptor subunit TctC
MWKPAAASILIFALSSGTLCSNATVAEPPSYPNKNIRLIVPFPAAGLIDAVERLMQPAIERALDRPLVIDNRPAAREGACATRASPRSRP